MPEGVELFTEGIVSTCHIPAVLISGADRSLVGTVNGYGAVPKNGIVAAGLCLAVSVGIANIISVLPARAVN